MTCVSWISCPQGWLVTADKMSLAVHIFCLVGGEKTKGIRNSLLTNRSQSWRQHSSWISQQKHNPQPSHDNLLNVLRAINSFVSRTGRDIWCNVCHALGGVTVWWGDVTGCHGLIDRERILRELVCTSWGLLERRRELPNKAWGSHEGLVGTESRIILIVQFRFLKTQ